MKTRIISGCVMLPLLVVVYLGGYWLELSVCTSSIKALRLQEPSLAGLWGMQLL